MRLLYLCFLLSIPFDFIHSQVIETKEFVHIKDNVKQYKNILKEDSRHIWIEQNGQEYKIPKSSLLSYFKVDNWKLPFKFNKEGKVEYSEVVQTPEIGKTELYDLARLWFANRNRNSEVLLDLVRDDQYLLMGSFWLPIENPSGMHFDHEMNLTIKFELKEERFKYTIGNIFIYTPKDLNTKERDVALEHSEYIKVKDLNTSRKKEKEQIMDELQKLCDSIKKSLNTKIQTEAW